MTGMFRLQRPLGPANHPLCSRCSSPRQKRASPSWPALAALDCSIDTIVSASINAYRRDRERGRERRDSSRHEDRRDRKRERDDPYGERS